MKGSTFFKTASLLSPLLFSSAQAQESFTHAGTGITFLRQQVDESQTTGGYEFGYALPGTPTGSNDEYIGYIRGAVHSGGKGWSGVSHGGGMPNSLLLVAYPNGDSVGTRFVFAGGYVAPNDYTGNATLTQFAHTVTDTYFEVIYRCQWCWIWNQNGATGQQLPTEEVQVIGWAQHMDSPPSAGQSWRLHNNGQSQFGIQPANARKTEYDDWVAKYTNGTTPTPTPSDGPTPTPTPTAPTSCVGTPAPTGSYDYIVVGAGAAGIPVADKLSESGKSVLLIEKGPPSLGRFGGTMKPDWLEGTDLTRFDVPGLCNQIWVDSAGVACSDIDQMAGCVLGGGAAVNAALWWNPTPHDWDYSWPTGWRAADMKAATDRTFKRIPGTQVPSMDGIRYKPEGFNVLATALRADGWKEISPNEVPDQKNRTFADPPYMYENGQRQGPLGSYLVTAMERKNFKLWMNTAVRRIIRDGGKATGVELDGGDGGYCGTADLNPGGRVIVSAGVFGSTKLLFRSGIGPKDQLQTVQNSVQDGPSFINETEWIDLPVGKNLNDHVNTDLVIKHPNVSFYDFYEAWSDPIPNDREMYLEKRSGILAQSAPNIGPMFWEYIPGADGIQRAIQYQSRVEPSPPATDNTSMTISQYLGTGTVSRGALSINGALNMFVSTPPYLQDKEDLAAVITSIKHLQQVISKVPGIVWEVPAANVTVEDFVNSIPKTPARRRSNHWIGSSKIGTDSGLNGGTSVVDLNTQVYGTENIHVVDASLFPGHIVTNPTSYIVVVAEHSAAKILALGSGSQAPGKQAGAVRL
ncbi:cellobiose dehydrogenase-like protein [Lojkania enalia]|uniref:Cellobiose dehydrogenase-like protein n=1 Tax=Lojkania enalia TaxID=147567 RepID=A0A9P4N9Y9_9PLEO|nr:cellobiose dehydrogenase-like protein [Didymosphaeria enalia]